jgi:hypothetical protein
MAGVSDHKREQGRRSDEQRRTQGHAAPR